MRNVHKRLSFICMGIYATAIAIFNMLPQPMQESFNQQELRWASLVLIGIGMVGKYVEETNGTDKHD